jgi:uncharacterized protein (DUF362 family)
MMSVQRRDFLKAALAGGAASIAAAQLGRLATAAEAAAEAPAKPLARVALTTGDQRADIAFRGMKEFQKEIAQAIGNRRVVVKPNNVSTDRQLPSTHAETLEGILEFLKSIDKLGNTVIAESAMGPTLDGFSNFGYTKVADKYGVKLVDLDQEPFDTHLVIDETDARPHPIRLSRVLLDPNSYVISAARMKTHDRVVATLSLKNIVVGAPIKAPAAGGRRFGGSDKGLVHGGGYRGININLATLAPLLHPHLAVIDGYDGMEGDGPIGGTPVDHRVCVVGTDWLAADRVGVELMGIDFSKIGYLNYCAQANLGVADLKKIEVVGENIEKHQKSYRLPSSYSRQITWADRAKVG